LDAARNDALAELAIEAGVDVVATNNVHYATPASFRLASTFAAVRARRCVDDMEGWTSPAPVACLRSPAEQQRRFARFPGVVERACELGLDCAFDLRLVAPRLPDFPTPDGLDEQGYLAQLVAVGATQRYGPRTHERVAGAWAQLDHELSVIGQLGYAGYFLIVWDLTQFCRREDIYCQGRGSAANSAVCYALGVTNADAVSLGLLFERFLSPARDGPPDIDVDIESGRREEVIQYVYARYGRRHAAQVANVITYRPRSAVRDVARALGDTAEAALEAAGRVERHWSGDDHVALEGDAATTAGLAPLVATLATQALGRPRHLGLHSAGMVICDRPVVEVCPVEWARMEGRSVLQWDKDDCAAIGLVKFDLLGLGMLDALHRTVDLVTKATGEAVDLAALPQDDSVYDLLCSADTVGVFQVESRAQMATLPRLRPRCFYDLVIEVALIRPGPIQGNAVNPYLRRRRGEEPVRYLHPLVEPILARTLGVPLFQEQLMEMAVAVAGFSPAEADELRQAMAAKRSEVRMLRLKGRLYAGMAEKGVSAAAADELYVALAAFANFGFPESHAVSFAHLVYCSAWLKRYHPAAFLAALLNAQPMGFWSPQSLVADARRHGVAVARPDVDRSGPDATLEPEPDGDGHVVRLGLTSVRGVGRAVAERIDAGAPWAGQEDLVRRAGVSRAQLEALAAAGALDRTGASRRALA
ncbi:MAG TPA: error-prone DNA polymerase, partial [Acidimicrobiales bacterium]|nr:error-prone DNA polymerase [Acidimicrobiales bacterium]